MNPKVKSFLLTVLIVFVSAAGISFLSNVTNVLETDWATWQIVLNAGIVAVVSYIVAWCVPYVKAFGIGSE